jgi:hypothetical protein
MKRITKMITYCDESMTLAASVCEDSALRNNVDVVRTFNADDIDEKFSKQYAHILTQSRGAGYWLWKPYFIDKVINEMNEGDILIYCDAGVEIFNNVNHIVDRMKNDVFLFGNTYDHVHWCKMDVIKAICPTIQTNKQVQASVMFFRVSETSKLFIKRWLQYCTKPGFIDDSKSISQNHSEFQEHRHDQAIITCLVYKYDMELHWWPAMYNGGLFTYDHKGYFDDYPVIFHHHRFRNQNFYESSGINHKVNIYFRNRGYETFKHKP